MESGISASLVKIADSNQATLESPLSPGGERRTRAWKRKHDHNREGRRKTIFDYNVETRLEKTPR